MVDISAQITIDSKFWGAADASNGKIVFPAHNGEAVGVFDPTDNSLQLIDVPAQITGNEKFAGAVATANGKIVLVPHWTDKD